MRFLIQGCGAQGSSAAGQLAVEEDVEEIICCDIDLSRAKRLADRIKGLKTKVSVRAEQVDCSAPEKLARVAKDVDLVFNGTYAAFNISILKACIDAGANYLDVSSLPFKFPGIGEGETMEDLLQFNDAAKSAGISAMSNMGAAPGLTDVETHYIADQLDTIEKVRLKWCEKTDADDLVGAWFTAGLMGEWFGPPGPIVWENGTTKVVDLLTEGEEFYEFPEPIGRVPVYTATCHSELFTVSKYIPEVTGKAVHYVELKGATHFGSLKSKDLRMPMKDIWIEAVRRQTVKNPYVEKADLFKLFGSSFTDPGAFKDMYDKGVVRESADIVLSEVTGTKGGKKVRHTVYAVSLLSEGMKRVPWANHVTHLVVTPAVMAMLMICRKEIKAKGVIAPEHIEHPDLFLKRMEERGLPILEKIEVAWT